MAYQLQADVRTVLTETNPVVRSGIQAALFSKGIREVVSCKDAQTLLDALKSEIVDLLLVDVDLPGVDICQLVQQVRQNNLGRNPFVLIIATVSDTSLGHIRKVINSGVDRVLRKPMPMSMVLEQVAQLSDARRPFVATDAYVGPSRRSNPRVDDSDDNLMQAPNTMRSKLADKVSEMQVERMIRNGVVRVGEMKVRSTPLAISRAIRRVLAFYEGQGTVERVRTDLDRMVALSQDLVSRYRGTSFDHLAELAASLVSLVMRISADPVAPNKVHLNLLAKLGEVLRQAA